MTTHTENNANTSPTKILVLGATGGTGRQIVKQALARGHQVTALVRSPQKSGDLNGVRLVVGEAREAKVLREALRGQDAVVSALGTPASPFRDVTLLSSATRALVQAMKAEHVARLVAITGIGAGDSRGHGGFLFDRVIFPLLLKKVYADKDRQEAMGQRARLGPRSSDDPERQARRRRGAGPDGSLRLPRRQHLATGGRDIRAGSTAQR